MKIILILPDPNMVIEKLVLRLHITAVPVADLGSKPVTLTEIFL
jgi:hypothetical protein